MSDSTGVIAKNLLKTRHVDLILTCPSSPTESSFFQASNGPESFYDRLDHGTIPPWLREVTLPTALAKNFKMFELR